MGRDFSDFPHQLVIQRKGDLHRHIIRESLGACFKNRFVTGQGFRGWEKIGETALGGGPLFWQGGAGLQSSGKQVDFEMGFSPGFSNPGAKARDQRRTFPGALKRSFPRINAGAPTRNFTHWVSRSIFQYFSSAVKAVILDRRAGTTEVVP